MTTFEITIIVLLAAIVALKLLEFTGMATINARMKEGFKYLGQKIEGCDSKLGYIKGAAQDISQQLDNIEDDILDDRRDIVPMLKSINDVVDKMHRNICADVAEKMVDRAFPIKEGEPLDKPFVSPGVTNWPPCYWGGPCTNPHRDCVGCPGYSTGGWTTTNNKAVHTYDTEQFPPQDVQGVTATGICQECNGKTICKHYDVNRNRCFVADSETTINDKSANSVSITDGRTDVTDGTLPEGSVVMQ